jgi:hypothetical protein
MEIYFPQIMKVTLVVEKSYTWITLEFTSQLTRDQVQGLTWFSFQSLSCWLEPFSDFLNSISASPEINKTITHPLEKQCNFHKTRKAFMFQIHIILIAILEKKNEIFIKFCQQHIVVCIHSS